MSACFRSTFDLGMIGIKQPPHLDLHLRTTRRARLPRSPTKTSRVDEGTPLRARTCPLSQLKIRQPTQRATSSKVILPLSSPYFPCPYPEQILRKGSSLLASAQLGPPTLCRQCALSQQNLSKGKLRQRKRGPRMPKVQKENLMNSVVELGSVIPSILTAF